MNQAEITKKVVTKVTINTTCKTCRRMYEIIYRKLDCSKHTEDFNNRLHK